MQNDFLDLLQQHGMISQTAGWSITPAAGGLNSQVYLAINPSGVPVFTLRHSTNTLRLSQEARVLNELHACEGVPQQVDLLSNTVLAHRYLPGRPKSLGEVGDGGITNLALRLACIHRHTTDWYTVWPSTDRIFGTRAESFRARLQTIQHYNTFQNPPDLAQHERIVAVYNWLLAHELAESHWQERTFQQLHGDLSYGNLIWDGDLVGFVDWEYSRYGDAAEEIAYLFTEQPVDHRRMKKLETQHLEQTGDRTIRKRLTSYLPLVALDSALWWMDYLASTGGNPADHPEVLRRLDQAERTQRVR